MEAYHRVWLAAHPERTESWLLDRLKDGFDIHHIDGDHSNNTVGNLVLIECSDHLMLHGANRKMSRIIRVHQTALSAERLAEGEKAYRLYSPHSGWVGVAIAMGVTRHNGTHAVMASARRFAKATGAKWPLTESRKGIKQRPKIANGSRLGTYECPQPV